MPPKPNPGFSDGLITLLTEAGMTKQDLTTLVGVELETVVPWLKGTVPDAGTLSLIAKALDTTMEWLIAGEGERVKGNVRLFER